MTAEPAAASAVSSARGVIFLEATVTKNPAQMRAACQWLGLAIHKYGGTVANGGAGTFLGGNPPACEFEIEIAGNARFA